MARISSHLLNGADGTHAAGVAIRLVCVDTGRELLSAATDSSGRISELVDRSGFGPDTVFEITFCTGAYWRSKGVNDAHILEEIAFRFTMPEPEARYHLPLIISPNGHSGWVSQPEI